MKERVKDKDRLRKIRDAIFYTSYILFVSSTLLAELKLNDGFSKMVSAVSLALSFLVIVFAIRKKNPINLLITFVLFIISLYFVLLTTGNSALVFLIILSLAARTIPQNKIVRMDFMLKICLVLIVVVCDRLGLISTMEFTRFGETRNSLGFHHPNFAGLMLLNIYLDAVYIRSGRKWTNSVIGIALFMVVWGVIKSRNAAIGIMISIILQLLPIKRIIYHDICRKIISRGFVVLMVVISMMFILCPYTTRMKDIDVLFSRRISISRSFYEYYGINLFGNEFEIYGKEDRGDQFFVLDNAYLYLMIHNGVVVFIAVLLFYTFRLEKNAKEHQYETYMALLIFLSIGLMEQAMIQPIKNPYLILAPEEKS